jgi:hypothetical protein
MMSIGSGSDRKVIMDVFVLDLIFRNMVHVDSNDLANSGVVEGRYSSAEFHIECPRFSTVECCIHGDGKELSPFDHVSAVERKKVPRAAACPFAWRSQLLMSVTSYRSVVTRDPKYWNS